MPRSKGLLFVGRLLLGCLLVSGVTALRAAEEQPVSEWKDLAAVRKTLKMEPAETAVFVGDMHCSHCAKKVSRKLYGVKGVKQVRTDLKIDVAIVTPQRGKQLDAKALWAAATASGILPIKLVGPDGVLLEASDDEKAEAAQTHEHESHEHESVDAASKG